MVAPPLTSHVSFTYSVAQFFACKHTHTKVYCSSSHECPDCKWWKFIKHNFNCIWCDMRQKETLVLIFLGWMLVSNTLNAVNLQCYECAYFVIHLTLSLPSLSISWGELLQPHLMSVMWCNERMPDTVVWRTRMHEWTGEWREHLLKRNSKLSQLVWLIQERV